MPGQHGLGEKAPGDRDSLASHLQEKAAHQVPSGGRVLGVRSWGSHFGHEMVKACGQSIAHRAESFSRKPSNSTMIIVLW